MLENKAQRANKAVLMLISPTSAVATEGSPPMGSVTCPCNNANPIIQCNWYLFSGTQLC